MWEAGGLQSDPIKGLSEGSLQVGLVFGLSVRGREGGWGSRGHAAVLLPTGDCSALSPNLLRAGWTWTVSRYQRDVGAAMGVGPGVLANGGAL